MANISFFELEPFEKEFFTQKLKGHKLVFNKNPLTTRNAKKFSETQVLVVFVFSKITKEVIDKLPKLKFIATMSTGFDHIDVEYAKSKGIKVSAVPFYGQNTVAEHAFGLMQTLNRHVVQAVQRTRNGTFDYTGLVGLDLEGKTLGILGTGKIGSYMIKYAKAFGMKVVAYDAFKNESKAKELGFKYVTLASLCKQSDFISLHLPLLDSTKHIIGKKQFDLMKKGVILVNTGRGPLIDTDALLVALNKKQLRGVALDVLEEENDFKQEAKLAHSVCCDAKKLAVLIENHELLHRENVIVTPHLAFYTKEALQRIMNTTLQNIKGNFSKRFKNLVK